MQTARGFGVESRLYVEWVPLEGPPKDPAAQLPAHIHKAITQMPPAPLQAWGTNRPQGAHATQGGNFSLEVESLDISTKSNYQRRSKSIKFLLEEKENLRAVS